MFGYLGLFFQRESKWFPKPSSSVEQRSSVGSSPSSHDDRKVSLASPLQITKLARSGQASQSGAAVLACLKSWELAAEVEVAKGKS